MSWLPSPSPLPFRKVSFVILPRILSNTRHNHLFPSFVLPVLSIVSNIDDERTPAATGGQQASPSRPGEAVDDARADDAAAWGRYGVLQLPDDLHTIPLISNSESPTFSR